MARLQPDNDAQHAQEEGLDSSSSNKPFPQRFTVVEHHPSGSSTVSQSSTGALHGTGSSSFTHAQGPTDSDRFSKNSRGMEERAKNELRDTLHWVSRMSGGPVDRKLLREAARSLKPNTYREVMTERWVADLCAYPPCEQAPRKPYNAEQPMYRINLRAKRVFDTSAAMKYCSDNCARRSIWYETVCLQQNAFEIPDLSQPVQLLEDTEAQPEAQIQYATMSSPITLPPSQMQQLEESTDSASDHDAQVKVEPDQYTQQAEDFLARLSIVERQPAGMPLPPSEEYAEEINQEDNPNLFYSAAGGGGLTSSSFNMDTLGRTLPTVQEDGSSSTVIVEERAGLARRIEIDVDPEYRDLMDQGFELYKQMKEAGEFT